jgi:hypothetical protein
MSQPSSSASTPASAAGTRVPNLLDFFNAIADSSLSGTEKAVCFAILRYRNQASGECFPSMQTLATTASLGVRAAQKVLGRLASSGVVIFVRRSRGGLRGSRGIPHTLRLDLDALRRMTANPHANPHANPSANPEPRARVNSEPHNRQPRTSGRPTPNLATRNHEPRAHKPSIEPSKEPTVEPSAVPASAARWMDAPTPRTPRPEPARPEPARPEPAPIEPARVAAYQALQAAGVRGPNLLSLARSPAITAELVRAEIARLRADPTVTHPPGALVKTLAQHGGLTLRGRTRPASISPAATSPRFEPLSAASLAHVRSIEQLRAMRGTSTCGIAVGDLLQRRAIDGPPRCDAQPHAEPVEFVRNAP